jgi:phage-related protein
MQFTDDFKQVTGINSSTLIIERPNQDPIRLDERLGLIFLSFQVDSPDPITTTSTIPGMDGVFDRGTTYGPRTMAARFMLQADNFYDYSLLETEVERLFDSREPFNIIDEDNPGMRWRNVKRNGQINWSTKNRRTGIAEIPLFCPSPYRESIGSLLDPYTFESELWQWGQNIPFEDEEGNFIDFAFTHSTRSFSIWNLGDAVVDPRHRMLEVYYRGASRNLVIENLTTGDRWQYNGNSNADDLILLDGVFSRKTSGGLTTSIFPYTNRKLIKLAPGENKIQLTGTLGSFRCEFDFRFLYL